MKAGLVANVSLWLSPIHRLQVEVDAAPEQENGTAKHIAMILHVQQMPVSGCRSFVIHRASGRMQMHPNVLGNVLVPVVRRLPLPLLNLPQVEPVLPAATTVSIAMPAESVTADGWKTVIQLQPVVLPGTLQPALILKIQDVTTVAEHLVVFPALCIAEEGQVLQL